MTSLSTRFLGQPKLTNPTFNDLFSARRTSTYQDSSFSEHISDAGDRLKKILFVKTGAGARLGRTD
jgi:hypothetical protein